MARIYISATYGDLKEHREKAYHALRQLGHDAVAMEDYVATDQRPLAKCLADVAACDVYVGIFAHRYGYAPEQDNPDQRSITELEYRHATIRGIPSLIFLLDQTVAWPPPLMDAFTGEGDQGARIRSLREELGRERLVSFFSTADGLAQLVGVAVTNQVKYRLVGGLPSLAAVRAWTIPAPVGSFTGRDEQLIGLRTQLTDHGAATLVPTAALYGMGGVGKTQLALAYAQRHRQDYQIGWWIPAETRLGILTAFADLGEVLGLPGKPTPAEVAIQVRDALAERSGWFLIFDNAPDPAAVAEFLPVAGGGHVLVTSRDPAWHGIAEPVPVDLLTSDEAVQLLVRRSGDRDTKAAARLANAVDRLPLALEQASAYVAQQHLTLARYMELFYDRRAELLARGEALAYQGTVDATFTLAIQRLRERNAAAAQLLELCALLAPDELPIDLLLSQPHLLPEPLATVARDPLQQHEAVSTLFTAGLLARDAGDTARMHRLIQAVMVDHLSEPDREQRIAEGVDLMAELFPYPGSEPDQWPQCAQLLAHAQTMIDHARATWDDRRGGLPLSTPKLPRLVTGVGNYLGARGLDRRLARQLHEQALAMRQELYNGDHREIAASLNNLAVDLEKDGEHERSNELYDQALAMDQRLYEGDDPDLALSMSKIAIGMRNLGKRSRARELDEQALAMYQRLYEGDHHDVANSLGSLASDFRQAGEHQRARELDEQAVAMFRRLYDGDDSDLAYSMSRLATDLTHLGEHERARELDEQALAMFRRLYEGDHRDAAYSMSRLATDLTHLGEHERARELDEQALAMFRRLYEDDHHDVAYSMSRLATDLRNLGKRKRARELNEQAAAMRQRLKGE